VEKTMAGGNGPVRNPEQKPPETEKKPEKD
jgi:hypothetical protein